MSVKITSVYNLDIMTTPEYPDWTPSEVVQNLQTLGLGKYGTAFLDNDVNGEALIYLKDSHLKELGVKLIGHRLTLINFINNLKSNKSIQPNRSSLRSTSSSHNDEISQKSTKPQYQDEENTSWAQRRQQQKQAQFRQQQQQMQQQQQDDDDGYSHRSIRKTQADDHNSYRVAKKVSNDDENNYFQSRNQRRNIQEINSDSDTNLSKQNDWEQKRKQVQMRQQYQQQQQQESQQPTRTLSNERFQNIRQSNFNDSSSSRKTPDQYSRRNQNSNYNNHYDDNDNFDEEENPFVSRPKIRDNPMSSPAVKTSAYSNNYHNNNNNDDDYDNDEEKEDPYSRATQRNQQRDYYYSSRYQAQQQQQRKTPSRQGAGSNPASGNRYSAQQDYQDDHMQSNRRQPYRQQVQQQYEDMDEDDEQGQDEEDDDQGYQDDYQKYQPPQRQQQQISMNARQQSQPQISNQPQERVECKYCKRKFAIDRIDKHEQICSKTYQKKKKPFDARKMRIKGSEAEQFIHKMDDDNPTPNKSKNGVPKYKLEHEKLISNLRAARQFTEYENKKASGKPVGPPPALPSYPEEDDDREPCPYCGRKFAPEAAKRHIPVCQRMNGNKSKMVAGNRRAGKR